MLHVVVVALADVIFVEDCFQVLVVFGDLADESFGLGLLLGDEPVQFVGIGVDVFDGFGEMSRRVVTV